MTDEEIVSQIREADLLLEEYRKVAQIAANALAIHLGADRYVGELGCWESGMDSICCHVKDGCTLDDTHDRTRRYKWELVWRDRLEAAGIKHVKVSSHG